MRTFTTDGPGDDSRHYLLPAAPRLAEVRSLVDQGAYFMVRAPARTGKTTSLRALAALLTAEGRYAALVCPAAVSAPAGDDFVRVEQALLASIRISADQDLPPELRPPPFPTSTDGTRFWESLTAWARVCPRPVVIFFDEIDTLHGSALQSILRQLEAGFSGRPTSFPWSIALVGQFDIRSNAATTLADPVRSASAGPFALGAPNETLRHFTTEEARALYSLHTAKTQQVFEPEAIDFILQATAGHPFLVHALGRSSTEIAPRPGHVTKSHMLTAARNIVHDHLTPVDALATRLSDPRVQRVIEPLLAGTAEVAQASEDDVQFVRDLGLLDPNDPARILGWIHQAIVPRLLAQGVKRAVTEDPAQFFETDGRLSIERLLHGFAVFYSAHAKQLTAAIKYERVAAELVLFGFLLSALEGRGWIDFDYAGARGRIDVTISVPIVGEGEAAGEQREVLVIVSRRKGEKGVKTRGLGWLENALEAQSCGSGTLVVFDRRDKRRPGKRIHLRETTTASGRTVRLLRA